MTQQLVEPQPKIPKSEEISSIAYTSFLEAYNDYTSNLTDAPRIYHEIVGLNLLSLAIGRTPILVTPDTLYPNLWVILVGRSYITRKSKSSKLGVKVISKSILMANDFSPEGLQENLSKKSQGLIFRDEIGGLLESIKRREYMASMADLLCTLYDCPDSYDRSLRNLNFSLKDVCFNILGSTTPARLRKKETVNLEDFKTGFLSRFLIVFGEPSKKPMPRRNMTKKDIERHEVCMKLWQEAYRVFHNNNEKSLELVFSSEALDLLNAWETKKANENFSIVDEEEADYKAALIGRMGEYIQKIAALLEVNMILSKGELSNLVNSPSNQIIISDASVQKSILFMTNILSELSTKLLNLLRSSWLSSNLVKLTKLLESTGGEAQRQHLLPRMNVTARQFDDVLRTAVESEVVEVIQGKPQIIKLKAVPQG
jgi:hypothetical protein